MLLLWQCKQDKINEPYLLDQSSRANQAEKPIQAIYSDRNAEPRKCELKSGFPDTHICEHEYLSASPRVTEEALLMLYPLANFLNLFVPQRVSFCDRRACR